MTARWGSLNTPMPRSTTRTGLKAVTISTWSLHARSGGPVLDIGCGTGMILREIAASGIECAGLDVTPEMIERGRSLAGDAGLEIDWVVGDARTMRLGCSFRFIFMTGHAFQHLLTDDDIGSFFDRVREHLLDDGYLAFETRNYAAKSFGGSEEPTLWKTIVDGQGREVDLLIGTIFDAETGVEHLIEERVIRETGERNRATSNLRYIDVTDLNRLLDEHGFEIIEQYGNWQKGAVGPDQPEVISICRLADPDTSL
ncbi:MAG: class I SAM-dependent methyltransferase [Thermomicrobiales bacterium]